MILFVGDKPSKKMKPGALPFQGAVCENRLKDWIEEIGVNPYYIVNASEPGSLNMALMFLACRCPIVALGNNASNYLKSYKKLNILHFKLPHPSGRNRQINDKEFISRKLRECREWISK